MVEAVYEGAGFRLQAAPVGHLLQALSRALDADISARLRAIAEPTPFAARRAGPQAWWIVGAARLGAADISRRGAEVADVAWLVDQTEGRLRFLLSGRRSVARLARGIGVDLRPQSFALGAACETQYAGVGVHLTRVAPEGYEILVGRSFADSLWEELAG